MAEVKYVLDACAIIAYLNGEDGGEKLIPILENAASNECDVFMHGINLYEAYYDYYRSDGNISANERLNEIKQLPIFFVYDLNKVIFEQAAYFKINYTISLADSFALSLAQLKKARLITTDHHEFDAVEEANELSFFWLR